MAEDKDAPAEKGKQYPIDFSVPPVVTTHRIETPAGPIEYEATVGMMPICNELQEPEAGIFYVAYTRLPKQEPSERPLMFSFNGGPGSSSVWLHLGTVGPKRVQMLPEGGMPPPPFELLDNAHTWLAETDLVFIDPVGTGYSRPVQADGGSKFWGLKGDIESVGEFIRMYLTRAERWRSPLYLVGESYGTTRAAGLSGHLIEKGIAFNGIVLVSSILNFGTASFAPGNDLPYLLFLPTYTATAWYHKRLDAKRQASLSKTLAEAEEWVSNVYAPALQKGDQLQGTERRKIAEQLAERTGLTADYCEWSDLRLEIHKFCKELLRTERRTVGRLDSRFTGMDADLVADQPEHDPSMTAIRPPYTAAINDYLRRSLGYQTDMPYSVLGEHGKLWERWEWGNIGRAFPDTAQSLRDALHRNPYMRVFVASGYFDLATPYFATEYTLAHLGLDPSLRSAISTAEYEAGHMMYIHEPSLQKLHTDFTNWMRNEGSPDSGTVTK